MVCPLVIVLALSSGAGGVVPDGAATGTYLASVKPVLQARCYACHGALKQEAGLRLDTAGRILAGSGDGPVVDLQNPGQSKILARVTHPDADERMPPEGKPVAGLTVDALRAWIAAGAPAPDDEREDNDPRDHWAFQRVERPDIPESACANPIDAFLTAKQERNGVQPAPPAPQSLVLRRLYLDLIGLPPTPGQASDDRATEAIVEDLLASPHHGERWGRHWMDVWRYSDGYGLNEQLRHSQKHLWHWRDWIVRSLNEDKGYGRMVVEMLAGDELAPGDPDAVTGTGFLARNYYLFNRTTWLDSTIEHTAKAFLALTVDCAKCHDHKYDPISQVDYYRFRAVFEPHQVRLDPVPGQPDLERDGLPRAFDDDATAPTYLHRRGDPNDPDKDTKIEPGVPAILASFATAPTPVALPFEAHTPGARPYVQRDQTEAAERALADAEEALAIAEARAMQAAPGGPGPPVVEDGFGSPDDARWEITGAGWEYRDGALHQTLAGRDRGAARLRVSPPGDFELEARFTTTGGTEYKSVAFRFDQSEDGQSYHQVYTSAHEPGPKVQVAHTAGGETVYPSEGRAARPIVVGQPYTLRLAVRDQLLNVWLDGELAIAYTLPDRRPGGAIALSAFDATVAFDSVTVRGLPDGLGLATPEEAGEPAPSPELARAAVGWRRAELAAVRAVVETDTARAETRAGFADLTRAAAIAQADARRARAAHDVAAAAKPDERKAAEARLADAEKALAETRADDGPQHSPLRVSRKALETPEHSFDDYPSGYPEQSTGRRLAFARWVVHRDNPLTARVAVNHVWTRHFGSPLVETVFDFGRRAPEPEHAALLDWLAAELMDSGWSLKHLHRLMVTSEVYHRSSSNAGADPATVAADPNNALYWRANPRRMEAQAVRDSVLHLAGKLDLTPGGPSVDPGAGGTRRSLYFLHSRDHRDLFLSMFDDADHLGCYRRTESVMPQQALALSNAKLAIGSAADIAAKLAEPGTGDAFVASAFRHILCREPGPDELDACRAFVADLGALNGHLDGTVRAARTRARLVHALLNHNDFVTVR